jgi:Ca2+-binding RTX toxin-like protein
LGAGDDVLDLRKGTLEGKAYGGDGADLYIISSAKTQMAEGLFGGHDTVQSSVKFQLSNFFEDLQLIGSNNISGRGNVIGNHVTGNTGDNRLFGYEGQDVLSGGAGNDLLSGGADGDVFVFKTGFGEDVISDFENGIDKIDLSGWETIANYSDLVLGHLAVDGADLVFTSGDEILRLKNVDISALDSSDFVS